MISILCPTRNRPQQLARMVQSVRETSRSGFVSRGGVEVLCYVDEDDTSDVSPADLVLRGQRMTHSAYYSALAVLAHGDILMMSGDDAIFRTPGWDKMVEDAFAACPDKILLVHGDDGCERGKSFATHPIISRRWVEITGRFTAPYFSGDWADTWLNDIANYLGRRLYLPFVNEHMHWMWGKAQRDATYVDTDARKAADNTARIYRDKVFERLADTDLLEAAMDKTWSIADLGIDVVGPTLAQQLYGLQE